MIERFYESPPKFGYLCLLTLHKKAVINGAEACLTCHNDRVKVANVLHNQQVDKAKLSIYPMYQVYQVMPCPHVSQSGLGSFTVFCKSPECAPRILSEDEIGTISHKKA